MGGKSKISEVVMLDGCPRSDLGGQAYASSSMNSFRSQRMRQQTSGGAARLLPEPCPEPQHSRCISICKRTWRKYRRRCLRCHTSSRSLSQACFNFSSKYFQVLHLCRCQCSSSRCLCKGSRCRCSSRPLSQASSKHNHTYFKDLRRRMCRGSCSRCLYNSNKHRGRCPTRACSSSS